MPAGFVLTLALRGADEGWLNVRAGLARMPGCSAVRCSAATRFRRPDPDDLDHRFRARAAARWFIAAARNPAIASLVTGTIGDAALGLDILKAVSRLPRVTARRAGDTDCALPCAAAAQCLASVVRDHASAAMDVSDGLAGDLAKLCGVSGVSAVIDALAIPLSAPARDLLSSGMVAIEALVAGGDDYEILCAIPEDRFDAFCKPRT